MILPYFHFEKVFFYYNKPTINEFNYLLYEFAIGEFVEYQLKTCHNIIFAMYFAILRKILAQGFAEIAWR